MIPIRESPARESNEELLPQEPDAGEGNQAWLARAPLKQGVLLLGGTSLVDFRVRVAQSGLRSDLTPSYWSVCGLLGGEAGTFTTAPLQPGDISDVPRTNAVRRLSLADFDDPVQWPNIAILRFAENTDVLDAHAQRVEGRRTIVDLPTLLVPWLAYAWAAADAENPLLAGRGLPSAAFVEAVHSLAGIDLTPGLSSAASCPEAVWQAVKWWREYYEGVTQVGGGVEAGPVVPSGWYCLRQRSAAVTLRPDAPLFLAPPEAGGRPR